MTDKIMASSTCKEFYARPSTNSCTSSAPTPWIGETSGAVGWGDIWKNSGRDAPRGADAHGDDTTGASSAPGGAKFENNMKAACTPHTVWGYFIIQDESMALNGLFSAMV